MVPEIQKRGWLSTNDIRLTRDRIEEVTHVEKGKQQKKKACPFLLKIQIGHPFHVGGQYQRNQPKYDHQRDENSFIQLDLKAVVDKHEKKEKFKKRPGTNEPFRFLINYQALPAGVSSQQKTKKQTKIDQIYEITKKYMARKWCIA